MMEWTIRVGFETEQPYTEDQAADLVAQLDKYGAVGSVPRERTSGEVTLTVDADSLGAARRDAVALVVEAATSVMDGVKITGWEDAS